MTKAAVMHRQDSGDESCSSTPRTSICHGRTTASRRTSSASTTFGPASPSSRSHMRTARRHSAKISTFPPTSSSVYLVRPQSPPQAVSYFPFPSPASAVLSSPQPDMAEPCQKLEQPPQTTHYWTSDRTRRLEYAAMDAANCGIKGWVRRNLMPHCLVPKEDRYVDFDDDSGSVRRYRLDLEDYDGGDDDDDRGRFIHGDGDHGGHGLSEKAGGVRKRCKRLHFWEGRF